MRDLLCTFSDRPLLPQIFFTKADPSASEDQVLSVFSRFGLVEEFCLFRDRHTGRSKGSGFVTMQTREDAIKALESLNNDSDPDAISAKWADPDLQEKKKRAVESSNADNRMLFFAKVLRSATEDDIRDLFAQFGKVFDVNVFRAFQGALTTKVSLLFPLIVSSIPISEPFSLLHYN